MKKYTASDFWVRGILSLAVILSSWEPVSASETVKMVPFHQVHMTDVIWRPRIQALVKNTLPHAFKNTEAAQTRLRLCAEYLENNGGPKPEPHRFNTSDLYKVMEGAATMIQSEPNAEIEALMDRIIAVIARAQQEDGYYDDKGGVQLPATWHLEVQREGQWHRVEIYNTDSYSTLADTYNTVHPANALRTDTIRIVMNPRHAETCVGILSVDIETE